MRKRSKRYLENRKKVENLKKVSFQEAIQVITELSGGKFDQTVDVAMRLGIDPKQSDQQVRSAVTLPHGTGKQTRVVAIVKGEKEQEAKEAGADLVGANDVIEKIQNGWLDFDKLITTPDMMGQVSKLGKVLGPKGLMPNPKLGTVTFDVGVAVKNEKKGKVEFRVDKTANLHAYIGKISFGVDKLKENFKTLMEAILKSKPSGAKGVYLRSLAVSLTHSPSIRLDTHSILNLSEGE